jgi:Tfp pilus assembly PilM family ATPase
MLENLLEKSLAGVYLTDRAITGTLVEKEKKLGRWRYKGHFHHPLPPDLVVNGQIARREELQAIVRPILNRHKLAGKRVNFLADTAAIINRLVTMPIISRHGQLKEAVYWEIKPFLPYDPAEIYFDYTVLQRNNKDRLQQVYIAALAKKQAIEYVHFLQGVGLTPWRIESKWMVLFRLWQLMNDEKGNNSRHEGLACLLLAAKDAGQFIVRDAQQGFAVRQVLFRGGMEAEKFILEFNQISYYLQGKYQQKLIEVKVIGQIASQFLDHLANEGIAATVVNPASFHSAAPFISAMEADQTKFHEDSLADLALAFGLVLGEVSNEA